MTDKPTIEDCMEQAQIFASAWSRVGSGVFGTTMEQATAEKEELEAMLHAALAAPAQAVSAAGPVGFDHKTAANFLNGKTVADEEVRLFVAHSRWAHDDRDWLRNTIADLRREIAQRDAEIALLKTSLLDAEAPQPAAQALDDAVAQAVAAEREACAQVCTTQAVSGEASWREQNPKLRDLVSEAYQQSAILAQQGCAAAIRARGIDAAKPAAHVQHPDDDAVDKLAEAMKKKLAEKRAQGRSGWDTDCTQQRLSDLLRQHVEKGDVLDVANFCAFLFARGERVSAAQAQPAAWKTDKDTFQFLSDVMTAAGLVEHGKQCKALAERLCSGVMAVRKTFQALCAPDPNQKIVKVDCGDYYQWQAAPAQALPEGRAVLITAVPQPAAQAQDARQPLTDAQIDAVTLLQWGEMRGHPLAAHRAYARAIEAAIEDQQGDAT